MDKQGPRMKRIVVGLVTGVAAIGTLVVFGLPGSSAPNDAGPEAALVDSTLAPGYERVRLQVEGMA